MFRRLNFGEQRGLDRLATRREFHLLHQSIAPHHQVIDRGAVLALQPVELAQTVLDLFQAFRIGGEAIEVAFQRARGFLQIGSGFVEQGARFGECAVDAFAVADGGQAALH